MKNMTLGKRMTFVVGGILAMTVIVGAVGALSLRSNQKSMAKYQDLTDVLKASSTVLESAITTRVHTNRFIRTLSDDDKNAVNKDWDVIAQNIAKARSLITDNESLGRVDQVSVLTKTYQESFKQMADDLLDARAVLNDRLAPDGWKLEEGMKLLLATAKEKNDVETILAVGDARQNLLLARLLAMKFIASSSDADAKLAAAQITVFRKSIDALTATNADRQALENLVNTGVRYEEGFAMMVKSIEDGMAVLATKMDVIGPQITEVILQVQADADTEQVALSKVVSTDIRRAQNIMIATILFSILAGIGYAFFSIRKINLTLRMVIDGISEGSHQVSSAATQMSGASQSLAESSSEEASTLEETSSSLEEMSSMTRQNADSSRKALGLVQSAQQNMNASGTSMTKLSSSMQEIESASRETQKIIKTIDEIAFQTNLLALNAAVEAARAGEAGAGFAVVADEVRNLARRAADAAKSTTDIIEGTMTRVSTGGKLVVEVSDRFNMVETDTKNLAILMADISNASDEQAKGIEQISTATSDLDKAIQSNAANSEETAASAEELNAQALSLQDFVGQLVTLVDGEGSNVTTGNSAHPAGQSFHSSLSVASGDAESPSVAKHKNVFLPKVGTMKHHTNPKQSGRFISQ